MHGIYCECPCKAVLHRVEFNCWKIVASRDYGMADSGAALVTGGSRRLGREIVLTLARRGFDVAVHCSKSVQAAEETAREARRLGVKALIAEADFQDPCATAELVERARAMLGKDLSVLVNNASVFEHDSIQSATHETWDVNLRTNLHAPFLLTQEFAKQAPKARISENGESSPRAAIVNLVDQRVVNPTAQFVSYSISKAGLWAFTQIAAVALAPDIRVNAIGPGPTLPSANQTEEHFFRQRKGTLLERGADLEDISAAINFILDSKALTGQLLCLDGGQHLKWRTKSAPVFTEAG